MSLQPLKYHGGKYYLAKDIIALMPAHTHYVEPYAGGLAVLLQKPLGASEVVNDYYQDLMVFWAVLRDKEKYETFRRHAEATPFSEALWHECSVELAKPYDGRYPVDRAWQFFVCCRQSMSGRMKSFTPITKSRTRRNMNNEVSAWLTAVEGLAEVHERIKSVVILNRKALDVIIQQDSTNTLFYLDPPYLDETRAAKNVYKHEMSLQQHEELLNLLTQISGKFLLSGYHSALYDNWADKNGYTCVELKIPNHAAKGDSKRIMTECIWRNFT